eukprot:52309-Amphidinium_carterae.1
MCAKTRSIVCAAYFCSCQHSVYDRDAPVTSGRSRRGRHDAVHQPTCMVPTQVTNITEKMNSRQLDDSGLSTARVVNQNPPPKKKGKIWVFLGNVIVFPISKRRGGSQSKGCKALRSMELHLPTGMNGHQAAIPCQATFRNARPRTNHAPEVALRSLDDS